MFLKNRYHLQKKIRETRVAQVYRGIDQKSNSRAILVKAYPSRFFTPDFVDYLFELVYALAEFEGPGIIPVLDCDFDENSFYLIYPWWEEKTLTQILSQIKSFNVETAVELMTPLAKLLTRFHRHKLVHGSLNPDNLFVDAKGLIWTQAFKIEDIIHSVFLAQNHWVDQMMYLAPEQLRGQKTTALTDVYAFAAVFYHLLCGQAPFGDQIQKIWTSKNYIAQPVLPSWIQKEIPTQIDTILLSGLNRDPLKRPASVQILFERLRLKNPDWTAPDIRPKITTEKKTNAERTVYNPEQSMSQSNPRKKKHRTNPTQAGREWSQALVKKIDQTVEKVDRFVNDEKPLEISWFKKIKTFRQKLLIGIFFLCCLGVFLSFFRLAIDWLWLSAPQIEVPNVNGQNLAEASQTLAAVQLRYRIVGEAFDQNVPKDHVFNQSPEPGKKVKQGRTVKLFVSKGTPDKTAPSLIGQNLDQLAGMLAKLKLKVNVTKQIFSATAPKGQILEQDPAAGLPYLGVSINVVLSSGFPVQIYKTALNDEQQMLNLQLSVPEEWLHQQVRIVVDHNGIENQIFEKEISPGQSATFQTVQNRNALLYIYYNNDLALKEMI